MKLFSNTYLGTNKVPSTEVYNQQFFTLIGPAFLTICKVARFIELASSKEEAALRNANNVFECAKIAPKFEMKFFTIFEKVNFHAKNSEGESMAFLFAFKIHRLHTCMDLK
jgi:hypothetical protein